MMPIMNQSHYFYNAMVGTVSTVSRSDPSQGHPQLHRRSGTLVNLTADSPVARRDQVSHLHLSTLPVIGIVLGLAQSAQETLREIAKLIVFIPGDGLDRTLEGS